MSFTRHKRNPETTSTTGPSSAVNPDELAVLPRSAFADLSGAYGGALIALGDALGLYERMGAPRSGGLSRRGFPTGPSALLRAAALAHRYREMAVLLFPPMPPPWLQRRLLPHLARLGERATQKREQR